MSRRKGKRHDETKKKQRNKDKTSTSSSGECESLRKVLRKRHTAAPQQQNPTNLHEDGTFSDFK